MSSKMKKVSEATSINSNASRYDEEHGDLTGQSWPLGIFWDTKTCPVPVDAQANDIAINIVKALNLFPGIIGAKTFYIYGKYGMFSECVKEGFQNIDVHFMNVPIGRKDSSDKDILAKMLGFAYDNRPHAVIMLISGDVGCAQTLHILNQRKHTIILIVPADMDVSSPFCNASKFVWDWPSLAHGMGFLPLMTSISHHPDIRGLRQPGELDKLQSVGRFMHTSDIHVLNVQIVKLLEHLETKNLSGVTSTDSNERSVGIFWDMENCEVPSDARCANIGTNILKALEMDPKINGIVRMFSAYGKSEIFSNSVKEDCQETAISFINVAGGRKDSADKAIVNSMFVFAFDNRPPASIMLISGDVDFAHALHMLNQRKFSIILVVPRGVNISQDLYSAGKFVWDWPSLARGEGPMLPSKLDKSGKGFVPPSKLDKSKKSFRKILQCVKKPTQHSDIQNPKNQRGKGSVPLRKIFQQRVKKPMQHSDIQNLKSQLMVLLKRSGGSLPLEQLESKYYAQFNEHLSLAKYGKHDLGHLLSKMSDVMIVEEKGTKKLICTNDKKGKEALDDNIIDALDAISLNDCLNEQGSYAESESSHSWEAAETSKRKEKCLERI